MAAPARPRRIELGRIVKPHGLKGEMVVSGVRLSPEELVAVAEVEAIGPDKERRPLTVIAARPFVQSLLVRFAGVEDIDAARLLHGHVLEVDPSRLPKAEEGTVYLFQLVGLEVVTEDARTLGRVADVFQTGATPILVVRGVEGGKPRERMIPMSPDMLIKVDTEAGLVTVRLLPGMDEV
jgi:16S rRNA processing protein RimM